MWSNRLSQYGIKDSEDSDALGRKNDAPGPIPESIVEETTETHPLVANSSPRSELPVNSAFRIDVRMLEGKGMNGFRLLRLFVEVGRAYQEGCTSRNEISEKLSSLDLAGRLSHDIPVSAATLHRYLKVIEEMFGKKLGLPGPAVLFVREGEGKSWSGLTDAGTEAWKATVAFFEHDST